MKKELIRDKNNIDMEDVFVAEKLTKNQAREASRQLAAARKKRNEERTPEDRLIANLLQLRFQLEDYAKQEGFDAQKTFGFYLKEYLRLINKKRNRFAYEIQIHETLLSQLINNHRNPADNIIIRLELHSNNTIPAAYWYRVVEKQKEYYLKTDKQIRKTENKFVTNRLTVSL